MAGEFSRAPFRRGIIKNGNCKASDNVLPQFGCGWYFSRKDLEEFSPSRKDGIDSKKESELRMHYCSFLKDFGMRLGVPQVTIATAIVFCHRFYLHQSHARNDWQNVATVCMFLSSKVEDTPLSLDKIVKAAYEMIYRKDPATARRIHQKDVFEKQKSLILIGEQVLLSTIRFDFNVQHPYKPLLYALKKFGISQKDVRQVAWNFVNDSLQTTLCLQYKAHYIAAGSIYLAANLFNVKLPSEKGYVWWHEFDVVPQQLRAAVQEMSVLLGYKRRPVVIHAPEKPTLTSTPLVVKEEASSSPESCVLSRPNSSRSCSSQCSNEEAARQKLVSIAPNMSDGSNQVDQPACLVGQTEFQCQARDFQSANTFIEDCQRSGEHVNQQMANTEYDSNVEACLRSGGGADGVTEPVALEDNIRTGEGAGLVPPKPEEFVDTDDCQMPGENMNQERREPEQAADVGNSEVSGLSVDRERTVTEESGNHEVGQHYGEGLDQARAKPEQVLDSEVSQGSGEHVEQISTKPEQVEDRLCNIDKDRIKALIRRKRERDQARAKPGQVVNCEFVQVPGQGVDQVRNNYEKVEDRLSKIDMERIKALMMSRKRKRDINKGTAAINDSNGDAWIERELEAGVVLTTEFAEKRQRLAFNHGPNGQAPLSSTRARR